MYDLHLRDGLTKRDKSSQMARLRMERTANALKVSRKDSNDASNAAAHHPYSDDNESDSSDASSVVHNKWKLLDPKRFLYSKSKAMKEPDKRGCRLLGPYGLEKEACYVSLIIYLHLLFALLHCASFCFPYRKTPASN